MSLILLHQDFNDRGEAEELQRVVVVVDDDGDDAGQQAEEQRYMGCHAGGWSWSQFMKQEVL